LQLCNRRIRGARKDWVISTWLARDPDVRAVHRIIGLALHDRHPSAWAAQAVSMSPTR
jgi:hypothetical protein